jgi:hypothetical protein
VAHLKKTEGWGLGRTRGRIALPLATQCRTSNTEARGAHRTPRKTWPAIGSHARTWDTPSRGLRRAKASGWGGRGLLSPVLRAVFRLTFWLSC